MILTTAQLQPRILENEDFPKPAVAFSVTTSVNDYARRPGVGTDTVLTPAMIMSFVQRAWKLNPAHANQAHLILAAYTTPEGKRLIIGAFTFSRSDRQSPLTPDNFKPSSYGDDTDRFIFLAEPAEEAVWRRYVGHYLRPRKPGEANPVMYIEDKE